MNTKFHVCERVALGPELLLPSIGCNKWIDISANRDVAVPTRTFYHEVDSLLSPEAKAQRIERLRAKCETDSSGCWIWTGMGNVGGYGVARLRGRLWIAHRLMYALAKGPIAPGLFVCHSCDVRRCINPDHLWLGTSLDNMRDASQKQRTRGQKMTMCKRGHPLSGDNVYVHMGRRHCRTCGAARERGYLDKMKAARHARGLRRNRKSKHPLAKIGIGETYRNDTPTKYFRRYVWNSAARLNRKFQMSRDGSSIVVTRVS